MGAVLAASIGYWLIKNAVESPDRLLEVTLIGITNGSIYALVALGYTLVYGIIELINFAHGDNFMLGTFQTNGIVNAGSFQIPFFPTSFVLAIPLGAAATANSSSGQKIYTILACLFFSMLFCMVINVSIERVAYRRLRNAPRLAPLITAIGMSFVLSNLIGVIFGFSYKSSNALLPTGAVFYIGDQPYGWDKLIVLLITVPVLLGLVWLVKLTRWGKAMRATAQDRDAARLMGIDVDHAISFAFGLGGLLAGVGGFVYFAYFTQARFDLGFRLGLFAFTAAVLGGIGNMAGAALGGYLIGLIENFNNGLSWHTPGPDWTESIVFILLILILVFRPQGLLGEQLSTRA